MKRLASPAWFYLGLKFSLSHISIKSQTHWCIFREHWPRKGVLSIFLWKKIKIPTCSTFFATFPILSYNCPTSFLLGPTETLNSLFLCYILMHQCTPTFTSFPIWQHRVITPWITTSASLSYLYPFCPQEALACTPLQRNQSTLEKNHTCLKAGATVHTWLPAITGLAW